MWQVLHLMTVNANWNWPVDYYFYAKSILCSLMDLTLLYVLPRCILTFIKLTWKPNCVCVDVKLDNAMLQQWWGFALSLYLYWDLTLLYVSPFILPNSILCRVDVQKKNVMLQQVLPWLCTCVTEWWELSFSLIPRPQFSWVAGDYN